MKMSYFKCNSNPYDCVTNKYHTMEYFWYEKTFAEKSAHLSCYFKKFYNVFVKSAFLVSF